jgi:hypothetical protein
MKVTGRLSLRRRPFASKTAAGLKELYTRFIPQAGFQWGIFGLTDNSVEFPDTV